MVEEKGGKDPSPHRAEKEKEGGTRPQALEQKIGEKKTRGFFFEAV